MNDEQSKLGKRYEIRRWDTNAVIYTGEADSLRELVERAVRERVDLYYANLSGAKLSFANLDSAKLRFAKLSYAELRHADLRFSDLRYADFRYANLRSAKLSGAKLSGATTLPTGESWRRYLETTMPALITAGGKTVEDIVSGGAWQCHRWTNGKQFSCPMAVAFDFDGDYDGDTATPLVQLLRPRIEQFVHLFDHDLIPCPASESATTGA